MKGKHLKENIEYYKNRPDEEHMEDCCETDDGLAVLQEEYEKAGTLKKVMFRLRLFIRNHPYEMFLIKFGVIPLVLTLFITEWIIMLSIVPTRSMDPTIKAGNVAVLNRLAYTYTAQPQRGDIITFTHPDHDYYLIKRIVATAGETVTFRNGDVYVDGVKLEEDYLKESRSTFPDKKDSFSVPEGYVFVMGDNRNNSADSRYWDMPYVKISDIVGKLVFLIRT